MTTKRTTKTNDLIHDYDELGRNIGSFKTMYQRTHAAAHRLLVSSVLHCAEHGNATHLNNFNSILSSTDKAALRTYISRMFAVIGGWDGKTAVQQEIMTGFKEVGQFLNVKDGKFIVMRNQARPTVKAAKTAMIALADDIITPDGKVWKKFLERNLFAEIKTFGDDSVIAGLERLLKTAQEGNKTTDTEVSQHVINELAATLSRLGGEGEDMDIRAANDNTIQ